MFDFTEEDGFDENLRRFLEHAIEIDEVHGRILKDLAVELSDGFLSDRSRMRATFNAAVLKRLEQALAESDQS